MSRRNDNGPKNRKVEEVSRGIFLRGIAIKETMRRIKIDEKTQQEKGTFEVEKGSR